MLQCQLAELKASQAPNNQALRSTLLDPSVNVLLQLLRQELTSTRTRLEETQNELSAWKFTPDSNTGKRLMAKCRQLYQENEELGKMTSSGRLAKLEGELALQKSFSEEVKKSQMELDEFVQDLDEDVEGMQSTIYYLQQELRKSNETVAALQLENGQLRSVRVNGTTHPHPSQTSNGRTTTGAGPPLGTGDSVCDRRTDSPSASATDSEPELIIKVSEQEMCDGDEDITQTSITTTTTTTATKLETVIVANNENIGNNNDNNGNNHSSSIDDGVEDDAPGGDGGAGGNNKRAYEDSDSSTQDNSVVQPQHRTSRTTKKVRRSSVLSLDYNDDDALVISTNGDVAISDVE